MIKRTFWPTLFISLNIVFLTSLLGVTTPQPLEPLPQLKLQGETPAPLTPLPGTVIPTLPGLAPTDSQTTPLISGLTPTVTATAPITASLTATHETEIEAGESITLTETAGAASVVTLTPTPFRYIRVQPREVAQSLLEKIIASTLIFGASWLVATIARHLVHRLADRVHPDVQIFLGRMVYIAIWVGAILWALRIFEVEVATITAIVGTLGLALSLSSQDLFKNFIAGTYLLMERPFSVGDIVKVGDYTGRVEFIDLRTTRLVTRDKKQVILPNTLLMSQVVVRQLEAGQPADDWETPEESPVAEGEDIPG